MCTLRRVSRARGHRVPHRSVAEAATTSHPWHVFGAPRDGTSEVGRPIGTVNFHCAFSYSLSKKPRRHLYLGCQERISRRLAQRDAVRTRGKAPLAGSSIERRQQTWVGGDSDSARGPGRERDTLEPEQPHASVTRSVCEIDLRHVRPCDLAGIRYSERG